MRDAAQVLMQIVRFVRSIPWIPYEYHNNMQLATQDFKAEVWAYATTVWEIFSRGRAPTLKEVSFAHTPTVYPLQLAIMKILYHFSL